MKKYVGFRFVIGNCAFDTPKCVLAWGFAPKPARGTRSPLPLPWSLFRTHLVWTGLHLSSGRSLVHES